MMPITITYQDHQILIVYDPYTVTENWEVWRNGNRIKRGDGWDLGFRDSLIHEAKQFIDFHQESCLED